MIKLFIYLLRCELFDINFRSLQVEGVWSTGVIPKGTRFGPFEGHRQHSYPSDKSAWRYFWRVSLTANPCSLKSLVTFRIDIFSKLS